MIEERRKNFWTKSASWSNGAMTVAQFSALPSAPPCFPSPGNRAPRPPRVCERVLREHVAVSRVPFRTQARGIIDCAPSNELPEYYPLADPGRRVQAWWYVPLTRNLIVKSERPRNWRKLRLYAALHRLESLGGGGRGRGRLNEERPQSVSRSGGLRIVK